MSALLVLNNKFRRCLRFGIAEALTLASTAISAAASAASIGMQASNTTGKYQRLNNDAVRGFLGNIDPSMLGDDAYMSFLQDWISNYGGDYGINMQDLLYASLAQQNSYDSMDYQFELQKQLMDYQQQLNSPVSQVRMMRQAGLNPDLLGISGQAGIGEQASAPSPNGSNSFNMPNSAQSAQADAVQQAQLIDGVNSIFTFGAELARSILDSSLALSDIGLKGSQQMYNEQMLSNLGLTNETLSNTLLSQNISIADAITSYVSEYYNDFGGKSFVDFDSLGFGPVLTPMLKSTWENFDGSLRKDIEKKVLEIESTVSSVRQSFAKELSTQQMRAALADFKASEAIKDFLTDFYSNIDPILKAELFNQKTSNELEFETEYDPELDAGALNSDNSMRVRSNVYERNMLDQMGNGVTEGVLRKKQMDLSSIIFDYERETQDIVRTLSVKALEAYRDTNEQQYLDEYYRLTTGALPAARTDRIFNYIGQAGSVLSSIAYGAAAGLVGRRGRKSVRVNGNTTLSPYDVSSIDLDNMILN